MLVYLCETIILLRKTSEPPRDGNLPLPSGGCDQHEIFFRIQLKFLYALKFVLTSLCNIIHDCLTIL